MKLIENPTIMVVHDNPKILSRLRTGLSDCFLNVKAISPIRLKVDELHQTKLGILSEKIPDLQLLTEGTPYMVLGEPDLPEVQSEKAIKYITEGAESYALSTEDPRVLGSRAKSIIRRIEKRKSDRLKTTFEIDDIVLNTSSRTVHVGGLPIETRKKIFDLLEYMVKHPNIILTRNQIFNAVWGDKDVDERNVYNTIGHLRRIVGSERIENFRGDGYKLVDKPTLSQGR